jgi:putative NADH-flavin reductase
MKIGVSGASGQLEKAVIKELKTRGEGNIPLLAFHGHLRRS